MRVAVFIPMAGELSPATFFCEHHYAPLSTNAQTMPLVHHEALGAVRERPRKAR